MNILEQRQGALLKKTAKAARVEKNGLIYYEIKFGSGKPLKSKSVDYESLIVNNKGGYTAYVYSPCPDVYIPLKLDVDKSKLKTIDEDVRGFIIESTIDANKWIEKRWIDKYMPLLLLIVFGVSIAIIMYASGDMLKSGSSIMQSAAETAKNMGIGVQNIK